MYYTKTLIQCMVIIFLLLFTNNVKSIDPISVTDEIISFRSLKYGMFIHYSLSTFDGLEQTPGSTTPASVYNPTDLDVDQWVQVAKNAGMKYAILTAKHSSGFCLWDSKVQWKGSEFNYDVAGSGHDATDVVAEFITACNKYDIVPGIYYCTMDTRHSDPNIVWNPSLPYISEEYFQLMKDHLTELHARYPDIAIQWIDIPRHLTNSERQTLYDLVRSINPNCLIMFNYGKEAGGISNYTISTAKNVTWPTDILNSEVEPIANPIIVQQSYDGIAYELAYEHCISITSNWFWKTNETLKSASDLTNKRQQAWDLNGNFLLNVPPNREGKIPSTSAQRLYDIAVSIGSVNADGVSISPTLTTIDIGATTQLTATVTPSNATTKNVSWSSSNTSVATVNSTGLVTGVAAGTATITVTTEDGGFTASSRVTTYSDVIKICPLGNSITQSNSSNVSYRYPLWKKLIDASIAFDFVGTLNTNYGGDPIWPEYNNLVFDKDHEGHWGWRANEIRDNIEGWLNEYTPDMVLIHIGTNDCYHDQQAASGIILEITQIIEHIRDDNPNVVIFLASLIPCKNVQSYIDALNAEIPGCVENLNTQASPVIFVDMASVVTPEDLFDGIHPGPTGEEKMAQKWVDAINTYLFGAAPVTGVTVSPNTALVDIGATTQLTANVAPSNAANKTVSWNSSNSSVASVNSTGLVTGVAQGTATITVTTEEGGFTATANITVGAGPLEGYSYCSDEGQICTFSGTVDVAYGADGLYNFVYGISNGSISCDNSTFGDPIVGVVKACYVKQVGTTITYSLSTSINGQGNVSPSSGVFNEGSVISITATADAGWQFDSWSGDASGSSNPVSITMDGNKSVTANFSEITNPTSITIQENETGFCSVDGSIDNNNAGFTGTGFANTDNALDNGITWSVNIPTAGSYTMVFKYANGGSTDRTAQLMEDGSTIVSNISMPSTGSWTSWTETPTINANLSAGTKLIRLQATNSSGLANIDYITISGGSISAVACAGLKSATMTTEIAETDKDIKYYPVPVDDLLNIEFSKELTGTVDIYVLDITGKAVRSDKANDSNHILDMSSLPKGLYTVRILGEDLNRVKRVVKQ